MPRDSREVQTGALFSLLVILRSRRKRATFNETPIKRSRTKEAGSGYDLSSNAMQRSASTGLSCEPGAVPECEGRRGHPAGVKLFGPSGGDSARIATAIGPIGEFGMQSRHVVVHGR